MSNLEKFITENRAAFDDAEPEPGHLNRFASQLEEQATPLVPGRSRSLMLKVAAIILLFISLSAIVFDFSTTQIRNRFSERGGGSELSAEIRDVLQFYDNQTTEQLAVLGNLTSENKEAKAMSLSVLKEIRNLDASTTELKQTLHNNPGNERIESAIIQNQQMKNSILNSIINQISNKIK
jgi:hypothetical protein